MTTRAACLWEHFREVADLQVTTIVENEVLPSLAPPDPDGDYAHFWVGTGGLCGAVGGHHLSHDWAEPGVRCSCGAPACPTCVGMWLAQTRSGITP